MYKRFELIEIDTGSGNLTITRHKKTSDYHFMENHHGLPQLVHKGYVYRRDRERARISMNIRGESVERIRSYWRCLLRSCRARCNVDPQGKLNLSHTHNHPRNEDNIKYRNLRSEIRKRALERKNEPPHEILEYFNIQDVTLEKTIVNWRYRHMRDPRMGDSLTTKRRRKQRAQEEILSDEEESQVIYHDGEGIVIQDGDVVLNTLCGLDDDENSDDGRVVYIVN